MRTTEYSKQCGGDGGGRKHVVSFTFTEQSWDLGMSKRFGNIRVTEQSICQKTGQPCYVMIWLNGKNFTIYCLKVKGEKFDSWKYRNKNQLVQLNENERNEQLSLPQDQFAATTDCKKVAYQPLASWFLERNTYFYYINVRLLSFIFTIWWFTLTFHPVTPLYKNRELPVRFCFGLYNVVFSKSFWLGFHGFLPFNFSIVNSKFVGTKLM